MKTAAKNARREFCGHKRTTRYGTYYKISRSEVGNAFANQAIQLGFNGPNQGQYVHADGSIIQLVNNGDSGARVYEPATLQPTSAFVTKVWVGPKSTIKTSIVDFLRNASHNDNGIKLEDVWDMDAHDLERDHKYLQWAFPTNEKSHYHPESPVLSQVEIDEIKADIKIACNLQKSFGVMLDFYGFTNANGVIVFTGPGNWLTHRNHNFLRITRILKSLTLLGLKNIAEEWFDALTDVRNVNYQLINDTTYGYWKDALNA